MRITALLLLFVCFQASFLVQAQELNFTVTVNKERASIQNTTIFDEMKVAFEQFLNGRSWTQDEFRPEERIKGNLLITINEASTVGSFSATAQVQVVRPIYGTNYESLIFNFADRDFRFEYVESQPLEFNRFSFLNNISSMLAFYANIALGLDYDSFQQDGGNPYFTAANEIANTASQSGRAGWVNTSSDRRNRFWLINDIYISSVFAPIREAYYLYHLKGMDRLLLDPESAYTNMLEALRLVAEANKAQPNGIFTISFMDAKSDEVSQVFKEAPLELRQKALEILMELDPNNARKYNENLNN